MSEHEYEPIGDPLLDAIGEADEIALNAKITNEAFSALSDLTNALYREQEQGRHGYISERRKLSRMLRRLAVWIDKNPPPPPDRDEEAGDGP